MPLTTAQLFLIRRHVGDNPDNATLDSIASRHKWDPDFVVLEVLETRYANLVANPSSFSVSGEYSQSTDGNLRALAKKIEEWRAWMFSQGKDPGPGGGVMTITLPAPPAKLR
jgi:hypothetical protein